ncbi:MAG: electron transport complex subunit RsxC [Actinobacteria bacterium]|nr:electron transport complex subunit RsxC [Actinomycetota bacterium]MBU2687534.1 electron transport complex subunit RsxC [Actinomycetota bacterium]
MGWAQRMKRALFTRGGVHPEPRKVSSIMKIFPGPNPEQVIIPLSQHIGAPCEPVVEIGDEVLVGQKIGDSAEYVSAPVHSSVSGEVTGIKKYPHPGGHDMLAIQITSDHLDRPSPDLQPVAEPLELAPGEIRVRVREGGIVGMGGAGFPTHVKLDTPADKSIEVMIVNGAECEPYLTGDYRVMLENSEQVLMGAKIAQRALGADRIVVGVEHVFPDVIRVMREAGGPFGIEVVSLPCRYPQGAEKSLIKSIAGREVPTGGLPRDVGASVSNVQTCYAVYDLFYNGRPLTDRVLTVAGDGIAGTANLRVKIGTTVSDVIDYCGGMVGEPGKVILGGPMMGVAQYTTGVPVIKTTSGIIVLRADTMLVEEPGHFTCIRCGRCVKRCPMNLMPYQMASYADIGDWDALERFDLEECMECGCCAYICPTKNPLVQLIKVGKDGLARRRRKMDSLVGTGDGRG